MRVRRSRPLLGAVSAIGAAGAVTLAFSRTAPATRGDYAREPERAATSGPNARLLPTAPANETATPSRDERSRAEPRELDPGPSADLELASRGDDEAAARLRERLAGEAARGPAAVADALVLALARSKDAAEADLVVSLVIETPGVAESPDLARALLALAASDTLPHRRSAALEALGELPSPDVERVRQVAALGRQVTSEEVRAASASALGSIGEASPGAVSLASAREIARSISGEQSETVRGLLVGSVHDASDPSVVATMLSVLERDGAASVRLEVARALGSLEPEDRAGVVAALSRRFDVELDRDVRLALVASIATTGREHAAAVLERLRARAGDLAVDVEDYLAGLRSGELDASRLRAIKEQREDARAASSSTGG
ncbi:hypothetical protein HY251_12105 [bacterium]|nr:hypothetical protein [bacterium]